MKKGILMKSVALALAMGLMTPLAVSAKNENAAQATSQHQVPVLKVTPENGAQDVQPDTQIQIVLDEQAATFSRFRQQFAKGAYELYLNGVLVPGTYDEQAATLTLANGELEHSTTYTIELRLKAEMRNDNTRSGNASYTFRFVTAADCNFVDGFDGWIKNDGRPLTFHDDGSVEVGNPGVMGGMYHMIPVELDTATFEATAKSLGNNGYAGFNSALLIRTGYTGFQIGLYPNKIEIYDSPFASALFTMPLDGNNYHTYRMVKDQNKGTVYVDGKKVFSQELRGGTGYGQHFYMIGDGTSFGGGDGHAFYKNLRIATGEACYLPE